VSVPLVGLTAAVNTGQWTMKKPTGQ